LAWVVTRRFGVIKTLQAEESTDIVVGVPFPLEQREAELLAAISDEFCGIDVKVLSYTREQYARDRAQRLTRS
jgi:hypothetical protein